MTTLVDFPTAKLLKEKGFKPTKLFGYTSKFYNSNTKTLLAYGRTGKTDLTKAYFAPTITQVIMWLYEEYGIWTVVNVNIMGSWYFEHFNLKEKRNAQFKPTDTHYDSPTEAYSASIEYTLNHLL